ncbi:xanthine dehydrogenase family protein molybdopterin-binding subunit [Rhizomonospora bruguierae]|uniref:xanthine dehydrogenase family protein molybdopterin-binding subunit n=1 Tax=Rhizomonospora bruguierae TaxID=1581705 RepID=UPI001BCCA945|nr:xanthine dehydrogenase family protein molybdopterin-binding subunit [Micromonospora sp. NBRC 107566]
MTRTLAPLVGAALDRVDGARKVAGAAPYPNDVRYPDLAYAALVRATISAGRVSGIETEGAEGAPGVLTVITHLTAPRLSRGPATSIGPQPTPPLQGDRVDYDGQYLAVVVAGTREQAVAAADLVEVRYEVDEPVLRTEDPRAEREENPWHFDTTRGDPAGALRTAEVRVDSTYTTPHLTNNPLGPFTTVARWDGDDLTVHDSTQHTANTRSALAGVFGIPEERVRVLAPFVGGGFGAGLRSWPHVTVAAMAARVVGRPVALELTRPEMFTGTGGRPSTVQRIRLGSTVDGRLVAIDHHAEYPAAMDDAVRYRVTPRGAGAYACPNFAARDVQVRLNVPPTGHMRAPGTAEGLFALECALDELAFRLDIDPVDLRLRNVAEVDPENGRPWTTTGLRECYRVGAERFGWYGRSPAPCSMRDGHRMVGYGMAGVTFGWTMMPCRAAATLHPDGTATIATSATDIGTGTYTILTQLAADLLDLPPDWVRVELGDTRLPKAPAAGGSGLTAAVTNAVQDACRNLLEIVRNGHPRGTDVRAEGASAPPEREDVAPSGAFAAVFAEVRVDPDLGELRVVRLVTAVDGGRIMNPKLAASQIIGGTVGGLGMALMERTTPDPGSGRIMNANLGDYLVPVHADVPDVDVLFVGGPDPLTPMGVKGVGEVGVVGVAPAVANAVHHATGRRLRALPLTVENLL